MKKSILLPIAIFLLCTTIQAMAQAISEGNVLICAGYGFPNLLGAVFNAYETEEGYKATSIGPVYVKGEYLVTDNIGIGINVAWANTNVKYQIDGFDSVFNTVPYEYKIKRSTYSILGRVNFHFGSSDKFDPYAGLGLGYRNANWSFSNNDPNSISTGSIPNLVPFGFELTLGAHYFFTDVIGAYAEIGASKSPFQIGLTAKFGGK
ncbi:MAG: outer membrane beta-barrel protein [Chitinophagales bacterium]